MNKKIYLHETIQITLDNRANYFKHMTVDWAPTMKDRKQKMVGIFRVQQHRQLARGHQSLGIRRLERYRRQL